MAVSSRLAQAVSVATAPGACPDQRAMRWSCHRRWPCTSVMAACANSSCLAANCERMPWVAGTLLRKNVT
jgi:hypothetical protein